MSEDCKNLFKQHNPEKCCITPIPELNEEDDIFCVNKCKEAKDSCCNHDCRINISGIYADEKIQPEKILKIFKAWFNESTTEEKEMFTPVIEKSLEKCIKLGIILISDCKS